MISMTWPQYLRGQCTLVIDLHRLEKELLSTLLMRHPQPVTTSELIEAIYLNPDREPEHGHDCIAMLVYKLRRKIGQDHIWWDTVGYRLRQDNAADFMALSARP